MSVVANLPIEDMSAEELAALGAYEQGRALNEIAHGLIALGREVRAQNTRYAHQRAASTRDPNNLDAKATAIVGKSVLDNLRDRAKTLRDVKSILQSLLRALP